MKTFVFVCSLFFIPTSILATGITGNDLFDRCNSLLTIKAGQVASGYDAGVCMGYLTGFMDYHKHITGCVPEGITRGQVISIFMKYANENPDILHLAGFYLMKDAVRKTLWPCREK